MTPNSKGIDLQFDPYEVFYRMLRDEFGVSPEKALERINRDLANNPLTQGMKLEPRPRTKRPKRRK